MLLRSLKLRAPHLAIFAMLLAGAVLSSSANAQSFSIFPEKKMNLSASPGALVNDQLAFENHTDHEIHIATEYSADDAIGIDMPSVITLKAREKCNYVISYEGGHDAQGSITLSEGGVTKRVEIHGSSLAFNPGSNETPNAYQDGNSEINLVVGPNPVVDELNISLQKAFSAIITVTDIEGKVLASTSEMTYTMKRSEDLVPGTYIITAAGITTSGKSFNDSRKIVVE